MTRIHFIIVSLFSSFVLFPSVAFAIDLITMSTIPAIPGPNQEVTLTINSFAVNLNSSEIVWYVDGEPMAQGMAMKSFSFRTKDFGNPSIINASIVGPSGTIDKRFVIEPSEVDLLWEANTVTPPFYKGKALPTFKSLVRVTAIPRKNSPSSDPSTFYYKWTYNRIQGLGEAQGMNSVTIPMGYPDSPVPVNVEVTVKGTEWKAPEFMNVTPTEPKVVFYEEAPLLGTNFFTALTKGSEREGNQIALRAVPYFFSTDNLLNNDLIYTWIVNGATQPRGFDPTKLQLQKTGKGAESFSVTLRIQNPKRILQEARAATSVTLPSEE